MRDLPHNWKTLSVSEWGVFLAEQQKDMDLLALSNGNKTNTNLLKTVLNKTTKPHSIVDWLKLICFVQHKHGILTCLSEQHRRRKIFSLKDTIQLPFECLGANAERFIKTAKQNYQYGSWAPPIRFELICTLYNVFAQLDNDILADPDWPEFWIQQKQLMTHNGEVTVKGFNSIQHSKRDAEKYFILLQEEILSAYRSFVIANTEYLSVEFEEDDTEHAMNESRVKEYFEEINYHKISKNAENCYDTLDKIYTESLSSHVTKAMRFIKKKLIAGCSITKAVSFLEKEITEGRSLSAYAYLPLEVSDKIMTPLVLLKQDYEKIANLVNDNLDSISNQFIPSFDQDASVRVLNLILQAREAIISAEVFKKRPEVGKVTLKKHLGSSEAITRTYQLALKARVDYFSQYLPNNVDKLVTDPVCGIKWIRYSRARREVLAQLFEEVLINTNKYPKLPMGKRIFGIKISTKQRNTLLKLQEAYFGAYQEDLKLCNKPEAEDLLLLAGKDKVLFSIPRTNFKQKNKQTVQERLDILADIVKTQKVLDAAPRKAELYRDQVPPEHDVTYGLFYELSKLLDCDHDANDAADIAPKTVEIINTAQTVELPIEALIYSTSQHEILNDRINVTACPQSDIIYKTT